MSTTRRIHSRHGQRPGRIGIVGLLATQDCTWSAPKLKMSLFNRLMMGPCLRQRSRTRKVFEGRTGPPPDGESFVLPGLVQTKPTANDLIGLQAIIRGAAGGTRPRLSRRNAPFPGDMGPGALRLSIVQAAGTAPRAAVFGGRGGAAQPRPAARRVHSDDELCKKKKNGLEGEGPHRPGAWVGLFRTAKIDWLDFFLVGPCRSEGRPASAGISGGYLPVRSDDLATGSCCGAG